MTAEEGNSVRFLSSGVYLVGYLWSCFIFFSKAKYVNRLKSNERSELNVLPVCHLQQSLQVFVWLEKVHGDAQNLSPKTESSNFYSHYFSCLSSDSNFARLLQLLLVWSPLREHCQREGVNLGSAGESRDNCCLWRWSNHYVCMYNKQHPF